MGRLNDEEIMRVYKKLGLADKNWNGTAYQKSSPAHDDDVWVVEEDSVTTISQNG